MAGRVFTLQDYIEHKGGAEVAREMGVDEQTVYYWKNYKNAPRPQAAHRLIQLTNGLLSWASIYQPFVDHHTDQQLSFDFSKKA